VPELVTIDEIRAAAGRLAGVALRTQLLPFPAAGPGLLLKPESLQLTGSFKLRGAYAAISMLTDRQRNRGVVAHSSGNHALAVAYAAALLKVPATVVIPANAPQVKVAAASDLGATIVVCEPGLAARTAATAELVERYGYYVIPPFEHRTVIAGQGTIGLEIAAERPDTDLIVCPVSGGGLISGIAAAAAAVLPRAKVVGVEPELAADARDSLRAGHRIAWQASQTQRTIADALRVEQVGELPLRHMLRQVHDIVTVSEEEIRETMRQLAVRARLVAEPGGAVAVAACLFHGARLPAATTKVAVVSGGNVDPALLADVLGGAPAPG
jgi:threo-3-hydroxy-L-aspartate ammonia-lyase